MPRARLVMMIAGLLASCTTPPSPTTPCRRLSAQDRWHHWTLSGVADLHPAQGPWRRYRFTWQQQGRHTTLNLPGPLGMPGRRFEGWGDQLWPIQQRDHPLSLRPWHRIWSAVFNHPDPHITTRGWSCQALGYVPQTLIWHGPRAWLKLWHLRWQPTSQRAPSDSHYHA